MLGTRTCRFEQIEPRLLLAAAALPIQIGAVYYEDASGFDEAGDVFEITFRGGAPGTQLARLVIETDKAGDGLTIGDCFFDVAPGGLGAFRSVGFEIVEQAGIDSVQASVEDGGTTLVLTFSGFEAGDRLRFRLDVDEQGFLGPNAVAEGNELEGSQLAATFTAPHYKTASGGDIFLDYFDAKLAGSGLDLPPDDYVPPGSTPTPVRTAAAIFALEQEPLPISLAGTVFEDFDTDNVRDAGDVGIAGVKLTLLRLQGGEYLPTGRTAVTDAAGSYRFENLLPGTYRVVETQPSGYLSVGARAGTVGGVPRGSVAGADVVTGVELLGGEDSIGNDFAEVRPASISGRVFADMNVNCTLDAGDLPLAGVTVHLLDAAGNVLAAAQTNAEGLYKFTGLMPGVYGVAEIQPDGYLDACDRVGSAGGSLLAPDSIVGIVLGSGTVATDYDFAELLPASISGYVYVDLNNNGVKDLGEAPIAGVTLTLLDADGKPAGRTTTTDAGGYYVFDNLRPGRNYGIAETQPDGYWDGLDAAGTAGGTANNPGDSITGVPLAPGMAAKNYNFGELPSASISGYVYVDANNNGVKNFGEAPIAGVTLMLLDADGKPTGRTTTTDAAGYYVFDGLRPGRTYGVAEVQPAGYLDGLDSPGTAGGTAANPGDKITGAALAPGMAAKNYNFGELLPASIAGRVHADLIENGIADPGEPLLAGVTIYLIDASGARVATTTTNAKGEYLFGNLMPGVYTVEEVQPAGYFDGPDKVGSVGGYLDGNDRIAGIVLGSGTAAVEYNFCELVPASISGYVFQDGPVIKLGFGQPAPDPATVRDGQFTPDDTPIAGVVMRLGDASGAPLLDAAGRPITTVTDARGYYQFSNLRPGVYTVLQSHPAGYVDSLDTPGSKGGIAVNANQPVSESILQTLTVDPMNDAILRISLRSGDAAVNYNFSEVRIDGSPPWFPPPPPDPPDPPPERVIRAPIFEPVQPAAYYTPSPTQKVLLPLYGGGGFGHGVHTWHLSVVNGGRPRRAGDGEETAEARMAGYHSVYFNPVSWTGADMDRSQWLLADAEGRPERTLQFGFLGGKPVTGDFNGDGITDVGIFFDGLWFLDLNGNGIWDEGDLWAKLGEAGDQPVTGDWDGDGKDDIGIFGAAWPGDARAIAAEPGLPDALNKDAPAGSYKNIPPEPGEAPAGMRTMKRTAFGDFRSDVIDHVFRYGSENDIAVAGDFNGDGVTNIGLFRQGTWFLDADGNGRWSTGDVYVERFGMAGDLPVVGDFNGDGVDDLGVYRRGKWLLDSNGDRVLSAHDKVFELGGPHDKPVVGDFNGDGVDEIAVYRDGVSPADAQASRPAPAVPTEVASSR